MRQNNIILVLIFIIIILTVGHVNWHNLYIKQLDEIDKLKTENGILSTSLEQCQETLYKVCQENDTLKAKIDELHQSKTEILEYEYIGEYTITAYCCEKYPHICGGGNTSTGNPPIAELTCAVTDLKTFPYGTIIYIEDVGIRIVQDTGGFHTNKIDVAVETHEEAVRWQNKKHKVWIIKGE